MGSLEGTRLGTVLVEGLLVRLPSPDDLQFADVGGRDFVGRRVLGVRLVGAYKRPPDRGVRLMGARDGGGGYDGNRDNQTRHERDSDWELGLGSTA